MVTFEQRVVKILRQIPAGKVVTYGQLAAMSGNNRGARQVVRVLHSKAEKEGLPWHRVINARGEISLPKGDGYELQRALLEDEGVEFGTDGRVDFDRFGFRS